MTAVPRVCQFCGEQFFVERSRVNAGYGKYCSRECYHLSTRKRVSKACLFCGKQFEVSASESRRGHGKFCSCKCANSYKTARSHVERICGTCGKSFQILRSWVRKGGGAYCSRVCRSKAQRKERIHKHCEYCGKEFTVYPYIGRDSTRGRFCSPECRYLWLSHHFHGRNSHLWLGGISSQGYGPGWSRTLKETIRQRDSRECAICRLTGNVVHHIDYSKDNHAPANLITLCPFCHGGTNHNRGYWSEALSDLAQKRQQYANV